MSFPFRRKPKEFQRQSEGRKKEAQRARKKHVTSEDFQNIKNKLGLQQITSEEKTKYVLRRFAKKPRSWKAIGITKEDFERFGIAT